MPLGVSTAPVKAPSNLGRQAAMSSFKPAVGGGHAGGAHPPIGQPPAQTQQQAAAATSKQQQPQIVGGYRPGTYGETTPLPSQYNTGPYGVAAQNPNQNLGGFYGNKQSGAGAGALDPYVKWLQAQQSINQNQTNLSNSNLDLQIGEGWGRYSQGVDALNSAAQFDAKYLNLDYDRLNADRQYQMAAGQNLDTNYGLSYGRYQNQVAANNKQGQYNYDRLMLARSAADQAFDGANRANLTDNTSRNSTMSQGFFEQGDEIRGQQSQNYKEADLSRSMADEQVNQANKQNQLVWDKDTSGYTLGVAQQEREKSYLDTLGKEYGVKGDQIKDTLRRGAEKLGLDYASVVKQLVNLKQQNSADALAKANALQYQLLQMGG